MFTKKEAKKFMVDVVSNPVTGRVVMIGSATRFQDAVMHLINDYKKRGIENVSVSLLSDFIMRATEQAIVEDVIDNVDGIEKLFKELEKISNGKN